MLWPDVGSLEWTRRTGGLLTRRRERVQFPLQVACHYAGRLPGALERAVGRGRAPADVDLRKLPVPRSEAARAAEELMRETMDERWVNHTQRAYVWAYAIGLRDRLRFDVELLYIATMLHDVGLVDPVEVAKPRCFSLAAVEAGEAIGCRHGWDAARRHSLGDTITRHVNLWMSPRRWPEAYLLHVGAKLDGFGLRFEDLSPRLVAETLARYPRTGFRDDYRARIARFSENVPNSRAGLYARRYSADSRRARAPFAEN